MAYRAEETVTQAHRPRGRNLPFVFIGSSTEGKAVAEAIQLNIHEVCEPTVWDQGTFQQGMTPLEALVCELDKLDFAILVLSADDLIESRGQETRAPRDNVLLELGLFIGRLGRHRTFVAHESGGIIKIPSDMAGVTLLTYRSPEQATLEAALGPACTRIKQDIRRHGKLPRQSVVLPPPTVPPSDMDAARAEVQQRVESASDILGAETGPPGMDLWYRDLEPVLYQSTIYTTPTYYLDNNLNIIDWNIAFDLIFADITPKLRYRHVNEFIARLANYGEVFDHGREFTRQVYAGDLELVDTEPLLYRSTRYGDVLSLKVATRLHDALGRARGWAVALLLQTVNWDLLRGDLEQKINDDKMWSVYSLPYDRILTDFEPYQKLLRDVASVIPAKASTVIDVGSGTGNSTEVLLKRDFRVTSVENNAEMIDRMRAKHFDQTRHRIVKASAESLESLRTLETGSFDGATAVNVLYSLDNPFACLNGINRLLRPNGVVGLSTTHANVTLDPLLESIRADLVARGLFDTRRSEYKQLYDINKRIERDIAHRHSADDYIEMVCDAGFEILHREDFAYKGAVMLIHARKRG